MPSDANNFDARRAIFCQDMVKQCDLAEKKAPNDTEVLFKSYFLKAQLYGCWQKPSGIGGTHKKAKECYEKMLQMNQEMGGKDLVDILYRYALFCRVSPIGGKQKAIENFKRVIEIVGQDSKLGIECAKELAKEEEKKEEKNKKAARTVSPVLRLISIP
jgi:tetratricopeptide (TPR) repeat protein